jgi:HK97 family phage major capsid protein
MEDLRKQEWNPNDPDHTKKRAEEEGAVDRMFDDVDKITGQLEALESEEARAERYERTERFLTGSAGSGLKPEPEFEGRGGDREWIDGPPGLDSRGYERRYQTEESRATQKYATAFESFLRRGLDGISPEVRATLQMDVDAGGGFVSGSERFVNRLLKDVTDNLVIRQLATVYPGRRGESFGQPTLESTVSGFQAAGELTPAEEDTGISFGKRELRPRDLKRKTVKISRALLQNANIDIEAEVIGEVNNALLQTLEQWYMTGDGAAKPLGLFVASADGIGTSRDVNTDNTATAIGADHLFEVQDTLKEQYQPKARWLWHRNTLTRVRKIKDGNDQYLWVPGLQSGAASTVLGKAYTLSEKAPNTYTAGLYLGLYGDFSWYRILDAFSGMTIQRLIEKYAEDGQTALLFDNIAVDGAPWKAEAFVRMTLAP